MAPSAQPYQGSHATLEGLCQKLHKHSSDIKLPERPRDTAADRIVYLDSAITFLGTSTGYLYDGHEKVLQEVAEVRKEVAEVRKEVAELRNKVQKVEQDVAEVKKKVQKVEQDVAEVRQLFINRFAEKPWDNIVPVQYNNEAPSNLPDRVMKLWNLQYPRQWSILISLLEFYDIEGWETWGCDYDGWETWESGDLERPDSDLDSDDVAQRHSSLKDAVTYRPLIALRALIDRLGMNYNRITKKMSEWEENRRKQEQGRKEKRKRDIIGRGLGRNTADTAPGTALDTAPNKLRKTDAARTSTEEPPTRLPIKDLVGDFESFQCKSSPESGTKIRWKTGSSKGSQK